jgi:hypothetical protein
MKWQKPNKGLIFSNIITKDTKVLCQTSADILNAQFYFCSYHSQITQFGSGMVPKTML